MLGVGANETDRIVRSRKILETACLYGLAMDMPDAQDLRHVAQFLAAPEARSVQERADTGPVPALHPTVRFDFRRGLIGVHDFPGNSIPRNRRPSRAANPQRLFHRKLRLRAKRRPAPGIPDKKCSHSQQLSRKFKTETQAPERAVEDLLSLDFMVSR